MLERMKSKSERHEERYSTALPCTRLDLALVCTIEISRKIVFLVSFLTTTNVERTRVREWERTLWKQLALKLVRLETISTYLSLLLLPYNISFNCCCRDCSVPTTFWIMSLFGWWNKWFLRFEVLSVDADEVPAVRCDVGDESKAFKRGAVSWWCNEVGRGLMDY